MQECLLLSPKPSVKPMRRVIGLGPCVEIHPVGEIGPLDMHVIMRVVLREPQEGRCLLFCY